MKKFYLMLFLALVSTFANAQVLGKKYDTKGNPKAKNVWMVVQYPNNFEAKEGVRPGVVQKFIGDYAGVKTQLLLQVKEIPDENSIEQACKSMTEQDWNNAFTEKESGIKASNAKKIGMEGKPGVVLNLASHMERGEFSLSMATKQMTVCYKNKMITLSCIASAAGNNAFEAKSRLEKIEPLCRLYFNSFVLQEQY